MIANLSSSLYTLLLASAPNTSSDSSPIQGLIKCGFDKACTMCDLFILIQDLFTLALGYLAAIGTLAIVIGGVMILAANGNPQVHAQGVFAVKSAIIGMVLVMSSFVMFSFVLVTLGFQSVNFQDVIEFRPGEAFSVQCDNSSYFTDRGYNGAGVSGTGSGSTTQPNTSTGSTGTPVNGSGDPSQGWSCNGLYNKTKSPSKSYYATSFGCWIDSSGKTHGDSADNCIPACYNQAKSTALCQGKSGPECERSVNWYIANAGQYGCLARLKVTNPSNNKTVVVIALDYGPSCFVEKRESAFAMDMSGAVTEYLFGGSRGSSDKAKVYIEEVPSTTPLGPVR